MGKNHAVQRIKRIVIDPGHGGNDSGTRGKTTCEKAVTLSVALKLGELIKQRFPEIEIFYTRKTDKRVELHERGNFANNKNADLFISIHVDGEPKHTAQGASTWVMGLHKTEANMAVSQRENSVITMEDDYKSKYEGYDPKSPESFIIFSLLQNAHLGESIKLADCVQNEMIKNGPIKGNRGVRQAGFLVLWKTAMPSILVELGFLTNPAEEKIIQRDENQLKIAENIFRGFCKYKAQYENYEAVNIFENEPIKTDEKFVDEAPESIIEPAVVSGEKKYGVQIMSVAKFFSESPKNFKGYKNVKRIKADKVYKYIIETNSLSEAKRLSNSIQKDYKGAFVVSVENGIITLEK